MRTRNLARAALFAALTAICSWISIPTAVPFTLQTFAVFLSLGVLGGELGALSVAGYLLGFLLTALTVWGAERWLGKSAPVFLGACVLGLGLCYLFGSVWYAAVYAAASGPVGLATVLGWCVFPFVLPDLAKLALAFALSRRLAAALQRREA